MPAVVSTGCAEKGRVWQYLLISQDGLDFFVSLADLDDDGYFFWVVLYELLHLLPSFGEGVPLSKRRVFLFPWLSDLHFARALNAKEFELKKFTFYRS